MIENVRAFHCINSFMIVDLDEMIKNKHRGFIAGINYSNFFSIKGRYSDKIWRR